MAALNFSSTSKHSFPKGVRLEDREVLRSVTRPNEPSYTYDTLLELKQVYPALAFVVGSDQLGQMHQWHRFPEILSLCHWIVLARKPDAFAPAQLTLSQWESSALVRSEGDSSWRISKGLTYLQRVSTDATALSSSEIRESLARSGSTPAGWLLPEVMTYLKDHHLYGIK